MPLKPVALKVVRSWVGSSFLAVNILDLCTVKVGSLIGFSKHNADLKAKLERKIRLKEHVALDQTSWSLKSV